MTLLSATTVSPENFYVLHYIETMSLHRLQTPADRDPGPRNGVSGCNVQFTQPGTKAIIHQNISPCTLPDDFFNCLGHILEPRILFSKDSPFLKAAFFITVSSHQSCLKWSWWPCTIWCLPFPSRMITASEMALWGSLAHLERVFFRCQKQSALLGPFEFCIAWDMAREMDSTP